MKRKKVAKYAMFFVAIFALLALPVYASFVDAYPAQIAADGKLTLEGVKGTFELPVDKTFNAIVPNTVPVGEHKNSDFKGLAIAPGGHEGEVIKLDGLLNVSNTLFWVKFDIEKTASPDATSGKYFASGKLNVTIAEITIPLPEINWVLMKGNITEFNETDAFGKLMAHARIDGTNNWTKVHGVFTQQPRPKNQMTSETYSCFFYVVTLANATQTELNYQGKALYIAGKWNVYNRTCTINIEDGEEKEIEMTMKPVVTEAPGELNATLASKLSPMTPQIPWHVQGSFTLEIEGFAEGVKAISGDVLFYHVKPAKPFEHGIPRSDFDEDRTVNILDLTPVAKAYGAKLGMPKYNFDLDANSDFVINIMDVSTAATEYGQEY